MVGDGGIREMTIDSMATPTGGTVASVGSPLPNDLANLVLVPPCQSWGPSSEVGSMKLTRGSDPGWLDTACQVTDWLNP